MKKRLLTILMIGVMSISMIACGKNDNTVVEGTDNGASTTVTATDNTEETKESQSEVSTEADKDDKDNLGETDLPDAATLLNEAFTKLSEVDNLCYITQQWSEMTMTAADIGVTEEKLEQATGSKEAVMNNTIYIKSCYDNTNKTFYNDLDMTIDFLGQVQNRHIEQYVVKTEDSYESYSYSEQTEQWSKVTNDDSVTEFMDYVKATDLEITSGDNDCWVVKGSISYSDISKTYDSNKDSYVSIVYNIKKDTGMVESIQIDTVEGNELYVEGSPVSLSMIITIASVNETPVEFDSSIKDLAVDATALE